MTPQPSLPRCLPWDPCLPLLPRIQKPQGRGQGPPQQEASGIQPHSAGSILRADWLTVFISSMGRVKFTGEKSSHQSCKWKESLRSPSSESIISRPIPSHWACPQHWLGKLTKILFWLFELGEPSPGHQKFPFLISLGRSQWYLESAPHLPALVFSPRPTPLQESHLNTIWPKSFTLTSRTEENLWDDDPTYSHTVKHLPILSLFYKPKRRWDRC